MLGHPVTAKEDLTGYEATYASSRAKGVRITIAVCERALASLDRSCVEATYRRSDLFQQRTELIATWANYVSEEGIAQPYSGTLKRCPAQK